jgi:GntR family transcriptional regulator
MRIVDGEPVAVENWYAPIHYLPGIDRSYFKEKGNEQSTYYMLQEKFNISLVKADDTISPVALEARDAKLLGKEPGMPALRRTRISYISGDLPMVYASGVYIIKLIMTLEKS